MELIRDVVLVVVGCGNVEGQYNFDNAFGQFVLDKFSELEDKDGISLVQHQPCWLGMEYTIVGKAQVICNSLSDLHILVESRIIDYRNRLSKAMEFTDDELMDALWELREHIGIESDSCYEYMDTDNLVKVYPEGIEWLAQLEKLINELK